MDRGKLYIVATPIGNLEDITIRAARVLKEAAVVAAEDTRRTSKLLNHLGIKARLVSCHEHNESGRAGVLIRYLDEGKDVALVTDAGMPAVSDPGSGIVRAAVEAGVRVEVIPGPSAVTAALAVSGFGGQGFVFEGFLPRRVKDLKRKALELARERRPVVFFEAPRRIQKTLATLAEEMPKRPLCLARELTKLHEEIIRGTVLEVEEKLAGRDLQGEITAVLGPSERAPEEDAAREDPGECLERLLGEGMSKSEAAREVSRRTGITRGQAYRMALEADGKE